MADFLPLVVTNFDQNASTQQRLKTDYLKQTIPLDIQNAKDESAVRHTQYNNSQLAQAAEEVSSLDDDQKASAWDERMTQLANSGVPQARQYIGRYTDKLGDKVSSIFGGQASANASKAQQDKLANNPQIVQSVAKMDPATRQKTLSNYNQAVEAFGRVKTADDLKAEVKLLQDSGIDPGPALQGMNLNDTSPLGYAHNYNAISKFLQDRKPYAEAITQVNAAQSMGASTDQAANPTVVGNYLVDKNTGKVMFSPPEKNQWEYLSPDKTGGGPGRFNKDTGEAGAIAGQDNYAAVADKIIGTEKGATPDAKNPNSSATGDGQFVDKTWLARAKKLPGLENVPDKQLLAMRNLPGFSHDMAVAQVKEDATALTNAGQPANTTTAAMAYKLGVPDALKVLKASPDTPLEKILSPAVMKANPTFKGQTAGTYALGLKNKFGNDPVGQQNPFGDGPASETNELQDANPESKEILGQTGLNVPAFMLLTGTGSQLARDKATRAGAVKVAVEFARKRGVDISTFKSQYKANNDQLEKNIQRYNNTKIMEDELLGTIQNLKPAANDATISNLTPANVAAVWAGQKTNAPISQEYTLYLTQLRSELAGYMAALRGKNASNIDDHDMHEAESTILNGLNARGAGGLEKGILNSTQKMKPVMERSIDRARQNVWEQFGVGKNYKPIYPNSQPQDTAGPYHSGDIVKGYKFKGGDYRDKNNWAKQ